MNIYDFDETIYKSDSTKDFYFYCLKKHKKILLSVPAMVWAFLMYILGLKTKTQFKEKMYKFLTYVPDVDFAVNDFWDKHCGGIKSWYTNRQKEDDIIISASPEFLLKPICERIGIKHLIASRVDKNTGVYTGENCWGEEKVKRLYSEFPNAKCDEFYSDSLSDAPLADIANTAKIIRDNELVDWDKYVPSKMSMFLSREFLMFLIIGGINTINGIIFAWLYSLFITNANLAFVVGYISAMVISYILNSKLTFKESMSLVKYVKFFISYMPNFIIQNLMVAIFYNILHLPKLLVFALAAVIGVPVTFVFMKIFAFKKQDK